MLRVLDLFSGIGGFSLGLERTGGFKTVAFCEIEPFCQRVLAKHWPEVPIYDDIRELTGARLAADGIAVDVICGGFPCQDVSLAGQRSGLEGARSGLWFEFARLIGELRPRFVIVENTPGLLSLGMGDVLGELAACGYDAEWECLSAGAVGAPHERERVWLVAYPDAARQANPEGWQGSSEPQWRKVFAANLFGRRAHRWPHQPEMGRVVHGISADVDAVGALGNSVTPIIPELIGKAILEAEGGCQ
jgi:DNA (cytosine-5)-methyltransferase 1